MSFSYKPLWKLLLDQELSKTDLKDTVGLSSATIAKLGKDEYVSMQIIDRLCCHFQVQPSDIFEWKGSDK
ncbi:helix-turn-helix domain-containing protein [Rossellomorea marisflavi]|uniref:Helix-turn-helix domain-containing protein n=1 Tax=Rossellomorea marisflavi TaxID=189381 RepID=A0A5D4RZS2_9BACI|nr:helix-turn-helix domain-containing protein [Rossellomorea marisflavi]TYS56460.1 helix-turn-helix domain-containing protein [Rossellomorea marisflavi]